MMNPSKLAPTMLLLGAFAVASIGAGVLLAPTVFLSSAAAATSKIGDDA